MAHRTFTDLAGTNWEVWDVLPGSASRTNQGDRRQEPRDDQTDRRGTSNYWVGVRSDLAAGWLCFKSSQETRRLAPIPEAWDSLPDARLRDLLQSVAARSAQSRSV